MMNSTYKVFTPVGQFDAIFAEDGNIPIEYSGDELAISFFKDWLFINQVSGEHGHLLDSQNLTPRELYGFCQPPESGIEVIPPFEDLLAYTQEDSANPVEDNDEQTQEENTMQTMITNDSAIVDDVVKNIGDVILDSISGIEKIKLIKEAGSIRANLQTVQSGLEKLKLVKRIKEIRDAIGVKTEVNPNIGRAWHDRYGDEIKIESYVDGKYYTLLNGKVGGAPIIPEDQLEKTIEIDTSWYQNKLKADAEALAAENEAARLAAEKEAEYADITGDPMQKGRKVAALSRQIRMSDGRVLTIKKLVDERVSAGDTVETKSFYNESAGKSMSERVLMEPDGLIFRDQKSIGKIGLEYAEELIAKRDASKPEEVSAEGATIADVNKVMPLLKQFIGKSQLSAIGMGIRGEEGQFFKDKMIEIANVIQTMPKTWEQDGMGDKAIAYLHYFKGSGDWHITEKDMEDEQLQAFGLADLGYGGDLGYISIRELIDASVELDLNWTPKTIGEIKGKSSEDENQGTETGGDETGGESTEIPQSTEEPQTITPADTIKAGFIAELESLKSETDINRFNERLDEIAVRIEQSGLMESLDKELNDAADVLTALLAAAEKGS